MSERIEFSYVEDPKEAERIAKIAGIISHGAYAYLKKHGHLKNNPKRDEEVKDLLEKTKEITDPGEEDDDPEYETKPLDIAS